MPLLLRASILRSRRFFGATISNSTQLEPLQSLTLGAIQRSVRNEDPFVGRPQTTWLLQNYLF